MQIKNPVFFEHYFEDKTFDGINYKGLSLELKMRHID